jgi:hypothetical protein
MTDEPQQTARAAEANDDAARQARRNSDHVITKLVGDVAVLKDEMKANTKVTTEVRDILTTFKMVGAFAKWSAAIVAAVVGAWAAIRGIRLGG